MAEDNFNHQEYKELNQKYYDLNCDWQNKSLFITNLVLLIIAKSTFSSIAIMLMVIEVIISKNGNDFAIGRDYKSSNHCFDAGDNLLKIISALTIISLILFIPTP